MRDRQLRIQEQRIQDLQAEQQEYNMADANVVMTAQQLAAFLQAQQAQMQQMIQAVVGAIPQQQQPAQPDFAVVPGGGNPQQPWALRTGEGTKMFLAATKALNSKFDGDTDKLQHFLDAIQIGRASCRER